MRYFLELSYLGKAYFGWQIQPGMPTVQQAVQDSMSLLLRRNIEVVGAGRTDTGVHASHYVAHFDVPDPITDCAGFCYHLNAVLPADIAVIGLKRVKDDAHARFDAISREYKYYVAKNKNPFAQDTAMRITQPLDIEAMNRAAAQLLSQSDFTSFCKLHSDNKTNLCRVMKAQWEENEDFYIFTVRADRFLRNMVRAIVGTLLDVGRSKMPPEEFGNVIRGRNRSLAGTSAPARGLFLQEVAYPENLYI